ncbi:glycoside hydrolase family 88 protein [Paraflavitalea speifideaquila]|uniref:glycoside hydrolase family 88 protein n=1 Tax=Paraflavitalea speifideaquila TaxID=3076558 RepID=UPI0028EF49FC|nr:glycoside hydrolase family 88 protein [Paraflavitalea speifideiaquila]
MRKLMIVVLALVVLHEMQAQSSKKAMQQLIDENMQFAAQQYKVLASKLPATVMPRSYAAGKDSLVTSNTKWWCSGFYPGTLWMIYAYTKDEAIKAEALKRLAILEKEKTYTGNHDLGFMMYCSFGTAYAITKDPAYKEVIFTAAHSLSTRYRPSIKAIQSWDSSKNFKCPVIIDNMMNLELLEWVTQHGGDDKYHQIAVTHSNTTLQHHFRADNSSYHVLDYNLATGGVSRKVTHQGFADESAWARGQAWGLYGYTVMYRFTKDPVYLNQAHKIAAFLLNHPNLPADKVPYWDFNATDIPQAKRDASAGSIMASALLELGQYSKGKQKTEYVATAAQLLQSLASPAYRAPLGSNGGFLLLHSVGSLPHQSEVDMPLTYADYYFIEALGRYKKWYL